MIKKDKFFLGIAFIIFGILFLIVNLGNIGMSKFWPIFPLVVGGGMIFGYFKNRENVGFLMPGSILIVISFLFFYCASAGWDHMSDLWPVFIIAPAVGFVAMYFGGTRDRGLLVPASILGIVGAVFIAINLNFSNFLPIVMIIIGIILVLTQMFPLKKDRDEV